MNKAEAQLPSGVAGWMRLQLEVKCGGRVCRRDGAAVMVCKVARAACGAAFAPGVAGTCGWFDTVAAWGLSAVQH